MSVREIIELVLLGLMIIFAIVTLIISIKNGEFKEFIVEKMAEAEIQFPKEMENYQAKRLNYVIEAVKEKYKIMSLIFNIQKFVEYICKITKKINYKK